MWITKNTILVALIRFNDSHPGDDQHNKGHYSTYHRVMDGNIMGHRSSKQRKRSSREFRGDRRRGIISEQFHIIHLHLSSHANFNPILVEEDAIIIFIRVWAYLIPLDICSPSWENE